MQPCRQTRARILARQLEQRLAPPRNYRGPPPEPSLATHTHASLTARAGIHVQDRVRPWPWPCVHVSPSKRPADDAPLPCPDSRLNHSYLGSFVHTSQVAVDQALLAESLMDPARCCLLQWRTGVGSPSRSASRSPRRLMRLCCLVSVSASFFFYGPRGGLEWTSQPEPSQ